MDYTKIQADQVWGTEIGRLYVNASPFITTLARQAYSRFVDQVDAQFEELSSLVKVEFTDTDPYNGFDDLVTDVNHGWLSIWKTQDDQGHPLLTGEQNDRFRAVHDYFGHYMSNRGFDRHGEEAAWVRHSQMFTGLARRAMTTETRGQSSAFIWINGGKEFPPQKAILLPDWVSMIPEQYRGE